MCGIAGSIGTTDLTRRILPIVLCYMSERGKDSWGVTNGKAIYRSVGLIIDQYVDLGMESPCYHTRHATVGAATERNAHPFEFTYEGKRVVGVHNGHINNWAQLKHLYSRSELECDSEHIFMHLAEDKPLTDLEGWGAVVWYEQIADGPIRHYHSKFGSADLSVAKLTSGEIIYASTERSLRIASQMAGATIDKIYDTRNDVKYCFEDGVLRDYGELKWGGLKTASYGTNVTYNGNNITYAGGTRSTYFSSTSSDICAIRDCNVHIKPTELVCSWCLDKVKKEYGFVPEQTVFPAVMY